METTTTCTITAFPRDETASFTFVYEVVPGTPTGTSIENTVNVSSATTELDMANNSATAPVSVTGAGSGGDDCLVSCPADVTVVAGANEAGSIVTFPEPTTTVSSCGAVSCSQSSGTFFPIGTTTVVCAAEAGDPCSFNVIVENDQNPTINCPTNISTSENPAGSGSATVNYPAPTASDNSGNVSVSCNQASGSSFPVGTTTVTCVATDESSNTTSCSFTVTVTGDGCVLACPENITVNADADSCVQSPFAETIVGPGVYPITITVMDGDPEGFHNTTVVSATFTVNGSTLLGAVGPTSIWLGSKNSDSVGLKFDVLAQAYRNGVLVGSGQIESVPGGSSGFNNAVLRTINMSLSGSNGFCAGDSLGIKVSIRVATTRHRSGFGRLWFNDSAANSRFSVTIGGVTTTYYLRDGFVLATTPGPGPKTTIDFFVDRLVGGNPFKPFGTWTTTF